MPCGLGWCRWKFPEPAHEDFRACCSDFISGRASTIFQKPEGRYGPR